MRSRFFRHTPLFADRVEAGVLLADVLSRRLYADPIVLALPRGGVPIGAEIARVLNAPLDVVLVRKIGAPGYEELALGALVEGATGRRLVVNEDIPGLEVGAFREHIAREAERQAGEIARRQKLYRGGRAPPSVRGRTAIVVDDGIATGASLRAALLALREEAPARLVAAAPVAPIESIGEFQGVADEVVVLETPDPFLAVGVHYGDFTQTSDEDVVRLLEQARARQAA